MDGSILAAVQRTSRMEERGLEVLDITVSKLDLPWAGRSPVRHCLRRSAAVADRVRKVADQEAVPVTLNIKKQLTEEFWTRKIWIITSTRTVRTAATTLDVTTGLIIRINRECN